jgi:putative transposase
MAKKTARPWRRGVKHVRYTEEQRAKVARDAHELGASEAARRHGVPQSNVTRWMQKHRAEPAAAPRSRSRVSSTPHVDSSSAPKTSDSSPKMRPRTARSADATFAVSATEVPAMIKKAQPGRPVAKSYTPSQRASALEYAQEHGASAASAKFGMSRFSIYEWQRKLTASTAGLCPSPTSGPCSTDIEAQRDKEILDEWKRHPGLGPSQIRNQLRRKGIKVSVHTVRVVMETEGYRPPKVQRHPHDQRFEAVRPNHLWHLDFVHRNIHRANVFTLILIDDHSRFVIGHGTDDAERAETVIATFERAVARYGKPEMVMSDRGAAFWSWKGISRFTALLTELGIDQIAVEHKETNGKIEVFNANLAKELFDVHRFADVAEMRRRLEQHLHWYNHARTHHALGGLLVPADRYYGRVDEVLARIEAGAGRDIGDGVDLRTRMLDLFKVVSRDGVPEVWLMGKKLLELRP